MDTKPSDTAELRRQAEEMVRDEAPTGEEAARLLHELHEHQIELKMQNEELRRAQAELEMSKARFFNLYDLAPVGYLTLDEDGLIREANLTAATVLGAARGALVGRPISRFILKEDQGIYYGFRKRLFETGDPQAFELRMVKMDGAAFWARLEATAAKDAEGAPVCLVVVSDIGERKRADEALRESEEDFRSLAESMPQIVWATRKDGWNIYFNQQWVDYTGLTLEESYGHGWNIPLPP